MPDGNLFSVILTMALIGVTVIVLLSVVTLVTGMWDVIRPLIFLVTVVWASASLLWAACWAVTIMFNYIR